MQYASSDMRTCKAAASASENTATGEMFRSRHARMIRTAISPRLAIRILRNIRRYLLGSWCFELLKRSVGHKCKAQSTKYKALTQILNLVSFQTTTEFAGRRGS